MLITKKLPSLFCSQSTSSIVKLFIFCLIALPFAGCGESGDGTGPLISSLSTPTEDTVSAETEGGDKDQIPNSPENETDTSEDLANIVGPDEEEDPEISLTSTPSGVTAKLTWDASTDPNVSGYYVYYGKQSSGEPGSCSYEASRAVDTPPATIAELEPNTVYFFAISAFGESESPCSAEVLVVTPPTQG